MSIFIAYPDGRIGREARDYFVNDFTCVPSITDRNRLQTIYECNFLLTKARDVPRAVEQGCLFGLTGLDFLKEYGSPDLEIFDDYPVCRSRLVLFEPVDGYTSPLVATVYPNIARRYLEEKGLYGDPWEILQLSGETESWVASGIAGRGIDIVETGKTLEETRLVVKDVIMESKAVIIVRKDNIDRAKRFYKRKIPNAEERIKRFPLPHRFTDGG